MHSKILAVFYLIIIMCILFVESKWQNLKKFRKNKVHGKVSSDEDVASDDLKDEAVYEKRENTKAHAGYINDRKFLEARKTENGNDREFLKNGYQNDQNIATEDRDENESSNYDLTESAVGKLSPIFGEKFLNLKYLEKQVGLTEKRNYRNEKIIVKNTEDSAFRGIIRDFLQWKRHERSKRHNRRFATTLNYRTMDEEDRLSLQKSRSRVQNFFDHYEVELREVQNSSVCNYTVIPIPDLTGTRIPPQLEHIKCNHIGSRCKDSGTYCCFQTYKYIDVFYEFSKKETMKIYTGCVCSLQLYGTLEQYSPELDIND